MSATRAPVLATGASTREEQRGEPRGRRRVLGLRPKVFAALLLSSAVTLAVAALALLSPLEQRLRTQGEAGVYTALSGVRPELEEIPLDSRTGLPEQRQLALAIAGLRRRAGAEVTVLDSQLGRVHAPADQDLDPSSEIYSQASRALRLKRTVHILVGDELVVAEPVHIGGTSAVYAVVLLRRLQYVISTVRVVRNAFLVAAAVGFGVALLLGLALTRTLLRRLERLRETAAGLHERRIDDAVEVDDSRDEIGDLSRAFAHMQERLRRQEQARQAFVATASHELRTPLAALDGALELLQDDLDPRRLDLDDARERTARAREHSRRLSSLASDLLDLSRLDADLPLRAEPVELDEVCRAVAAEFERRAGERDVEIRVEPAAAPCWAQGDPGSLARIVRILLDNACGVAPAGSTVLVRTRGDEEGASLLVSDSGPGVPVSERELIFERFQRGSSTGGRSGFGLGLAIGRELARRMGGALTLLDGSGEAPDGRLGAGACFQLTMPAASAADTAAEEV